MTTEHTIPQKQGTSAAYGKPWALTTIILTIIKL